MARRANKAGGGGKGEELEEDEQSERHDGVWGGELSVVHDGGPPPYKLPP
eukprot:CAMPEP_0175074312 /NCGR_PEP_ID=MMETSP0052_2-20121109/21215_1 /TAXON_ID=51329 ORGANISM="Polytomella parva, Strain SAG 63-3" /NCGR_SAMPLE_ID=MMETSP0052_2 /ASSEMBLY_ACC=CAM_ASM_000194 /LENGTH=49 /DNA_ID= /DNA_START= /DNA_END= /DNA_ORIENTATION=